MPLCFLWGRQWVVQSVTGQAKLLSPVLGYILFTQQPAALPVDWRKEDIPIHYNRKSRSNHRLTLTLSLLLRL